MKIEQLNSNKVRVRISRDEMLEMNVNPEMIVSDSDALSSLLMNILQEIYDKTDFNPFFGGMTMEASQDGDGICILLSRIGNMAKHTDNDNDIEDLIKLLERVKKTSGSIHIGRISSPRGRDGSERNDRRKNDEFRPKIKSVRAIKLDELKRAGGRTVDIHTITFIFNDFEDMCRALCTASENGVKKAQLYRLDGKYMLLMPVTEDVLGDNSVFMEYASDVKRRMAHLYVSEHGEFIAKGEALLNMRRKMSELV